MRAVIPLLLLALACGRRGPDGAPAAPDVTTATPPASSPVPPAVPPPATPDPAPTASTDWTLEAVGTTEPCSVNFGCPHPALAIDGTGAPLFGVHRYNLGACLWCSADRIVRRWNGSAWETLMSDSGWPGGASDVSFARDPATGATLFADTDLGDVRHPPIASHVWTLASGAVTELRPPLGGAGWTGDPLLAVDDAGTVTITWIEEDPPSQVFVRRVARSAGGAWDQLPDLPSVPAGGAGIVLDATGAPVVAGCGATGIQVARWDAGERAWQLLPSPPSPSGVCSVRLLRDEDGLLLASGWSSSVSVDRWDGTSWTPFGRGLGERLLDFARSPRGTPLLVTALGILERTDDWHVVAPPDAAAPDDVTIPEAIASGDHEVWTWWTRESTAAHPAGGQLRRMTLRR